MKPFSIDETYIRNSNYSQLQGKCLEPDAVTYCSPNYVPMVQKKTFNDPLLPKHLDKNTIYGIITKTKLSAGDVIFPNNSPGENGIEDKKETELYKISHHTYGIGEQLNRKYTNNFNPDYRYGKSLKRLPAGVWFKSNVQPKSLNEDKNTITDYVSKLLESKENTRCRYPYIDHRQGKFIGRSFLRAQDILTRNEPDKKYFELIDYSTAVSRLKHYIKEKKCDLRELHETFKLFDKEFTGWLPLEQLYKICYQHKIKPEKKLFDLALQSINAINNNKVSYNLFLDLLDPNVKFSTGFKKNNRTDIDRFIPTYKNDYGNTLSRTIQLNKDRNDYMPVKPMVLAYLDCFGSETDVKTLLNPTIFSNYGLTYRDFYIGRSKHVMKKLFQDLGVILPNDIFNIIWDNAYQCDGVDDKVSVEVFRQALQELANRMLDQHGEE
ncbi:uncharacterized protein LOC132948519 [Metopolophium dirhodum]|uniref:uncharacterized protein LOC132948519 n=1 Tax=Metopolophium dirhodum TaxID=44670 RepID=UPI00298F5222|nr:uncharacterized protein LOC132948519 [Metopolophium dirhodum]